ncbi:MAG: NERD domain-containing serine/threonine-protein kinase [Sterolibacterium sp.]|nr:NERD domain-containing serine/threonine-protein kinase [Sterolibacterium sp.]
MKKQQMANFRHIPCGPCVNESERIAIECLKARLQNAASGPWLLLSNLNHSVSAQRRSDEIDGVLIGPPGVVVIEVKHWDKDYLKVGVEAEADLLDTKAKRIRGKIPQGIAPGFVEGRFLLTRGQLRLANQAPVRGIRFFGLPECGELASINAPARLSSGEIERIAKALVPRVSVALSGDLRRFGSLINLEQLSPKSDAFHRIYRGEHATRREKVILHLYDLSANDEKNALEKARREFEVIQRWQKSPNMPGLLDSFQEAEGYPGEMYFFSLPDPIAPTLEQRQKDPSWSWDERLRYTIESVKALSGFHQPEYPNEALCLRRISPKSLRVQRNGIPLFTDFSLTRIANSQTISTQEQIDLGDLAPYAAPEIHHGGFAAADARSDVYALCASLRPLFSNEDGVQNVLEQGMAQNPEGRPFTHELAQMLEELLAEPAVAKKKSIPLLPAPDYWDDNTVVPFKGSYYRILERLGKGGIGWTFKVCELDKNQEETYGTYVAKTIRHEEDAKTALRAYQRVRDKTDVPTLSNLKEVAPDWQENNFVALLRWVDGGPLDELTGVLSIHSEDLGETSTEDMVLRWLLGITDGLAALHTQGLIHGDVSPRNILVQQGMVVLTDYDTVVGIDEQPTGSLQGNPIYSSPGREKGWPYAASDDIFSLAASFFHVLFERDPFERGTVREKSLGLNWEGIDTTGYERLQVFLDQATNPAAGERLHDASAAHTLLRQLMDTTKGQPLTQLVDEPKPATVKQEEETHSLKPPGPHQTIWLSNLLSTYPGSRHGNAETRGLDSEFAVATYVETDLDRSLREKVERAQVELVILFGNAGDGKTAFLQHLLKGLGLTADKLHSSQRVIRHTLGDSRKLLVNLDGSASWNGKSANELLDDIFKPFLTGGVRRDLVHVVAVNSGKLMEWIDWKDENNNETPLLLEQIRSALQGEQDALNDRHILIDLNNRSLVGAVDQNKNNITTHFLDELLNRMLGEDVPQGPWAGCPSCSAHDRCTAWNSVQHLREEQQGAFIRQQLKDALQASHQRGEIHITARELRAALSYIFFGIHDCQELHDDPGIRPQSFADRTFDAFSPQRQGELLAELCRFDPALESHPAVDRWLKKTKNFAGLQLASARRLAWFTTSPNSLPGDIGLYQGQTLERFRRVPFMSEAEKDALLRQLCLGIAHLEDLPDEAFKKSDGAPLKITPRTPTESAFWVVKPWSRFRLEAPLSRSEELEVLHTHLHLIYTPTKSQEETLRIGLELFHLLLDLADGVQLSGAGQEGIFANLEIFTQRLAQEDTRELHAWHPMRESLVDRIKVECRDDQQWLVREVLA